jgi:peptidoglycan hydrolase CwlO-like protein
VFGAFFNLHITNFRPRLSATKNQPNVYTMASPANTVPSTQFLPTKDVEPGAPASEFALFQSICFQEPYKNYSPEELRVADYARLPATPKTISQLEQELKLKSSKVEQLQLQVEQFQQQMTPLKEKHEQKLSKVELMQQQLASFKHQV